MIVFLVLAFLSSTTADYWLDRAHMIKSDQSEAIGSSIILDEKEEIVNKLLMAMKIEEFDRGLADPANFLPAVHFFHAKNKIEDSLLFHFIRKIPKGASLHSHDTALVSFEYLYNLTFSENLYGCVENNRLQLRFFGEKVNTNCKWVLMKELREQNKTFDNFVKQQLTLVVDDPAVEYPTINVVWTVFLQIFGTVFGMVSYRPIFQAYFYQALKELYEDNVMYIEFRGLLPEVYELNGTTYNAAEIVQLYYETLQLFKKDHPDFHGGKFIYAPSRNVDNSTANHYVETATLLKQMYPDFVAGFDLVGQEDQGKPLVDFIPQLLELATNHNMKFFFHAAETDWFGITDMNLFDAVLLNTTRIGHGYGIVKHPLLLEEVKKRQIALEISPISNQVLKLVADLRNHPAASLVAGGYPLVITCDDPTFWGAKALSYDWYVAFMAFGSRESDLRILKQLALNSLLYSSMEEEEKCDAISKWQLQWNYFIDSIANQENENDRDCHSVNMVR